MFKTNFIKSVKEERVPENMKRWKPRKFWWGGKEDMKKRGLCINYHVFMSLFYLSHSFVLFIIFLGQKLGQNKTNKHGCGLTRKGHTWKPGKWCRRQKQVRTMLQKSGRPPVNWETLPLRQNKEEDHIIVDMILHEIAKTLPLAYLKWILWFRDW